MVKRSFRKQRSTRRSRVAIRSKRNTYRKKKGQLD